MSDLISRSELLKEIEKYKFGAISNDAEREYIKKTILDFIICQPTAYSVDKVVEELKTDSSVKLYGSGNSDNYLIPDKRAIEIVKQGGVLTNNRKDCEYRHDNGNCLKVGGFCTSVDDKHCEKMNQGGVSDDVCEWKQTSTARYKTRCGYKLEEYFDTKACYCKQCGKKIKVVE